MAERPAKLARLQSLRDRLPYISQSALAAVLKVAASEELPHVSGRSDFRHARNATASTSTPYGTLCSPIELPRKNGGPPINVEVQNPFAMLYHSCSVSRSLSGLIKRCIEKRPSTLSSPWSIILYTDEVTPGNQLGYKNQCKFWAIYWSVLEWGPQVLSDEDRSKPNDRMLYVVCFMLHALVASLYRMRHAENVHIHILCSVLKH